MSLTIVIDRRGDGLAIYDEALDLHQLGTLSITRASHVEPSAVGTWSADLAPVGGPKLGPFAQRSAAIEAEIRWLQSWLRRLSDS